MSSFGSTVVALHMGNNFKIFVVMSLNSDWKGSLDSKYKEQSF
jgi:hypothetical protein